MRLRSLVWLFLSAIAGWGVLQAQKPFKDYPGVEYENFVLPEDWQTSERRRIKTLLERLLSIFR